MKLMELRRYKEGKEAKEIAELLRFFRFLRFFYASTIALMERYDASSVEAKWQQRWLKAKAYEADLRKAKNPHYSLVMFPYPSGDKLHVGHWYNFAPADSHARYMRMQGKDVFTPMGFDAFGLPAENYAIKTGIHPAQSIDENTKTM